MKLEEVLEKVVERAEKEGKASLSYRIIFSLEKGEITSAGEVYVTEPIGFTPLARMVKEKVEEVFGSLKLEKAIGFRGEIYGNERVEMVIDAGWGTLIIDILKRM